MLLKDKVSNDSIKILILTNLQPEWAMLGHMILRLKSSETVWEGTYIVDSPYDRYQRFPGKPSLENTPPSPPKTYLCSLKFKYSSLSPPAYFLVDFQYLDGQKVPAHLYFPGILPSQH